MSSLWMISDIFGGKYIFTHNATMAGLRINKLNLAIILDNKKPLKHRRGLVFTWSRWSDSNRPPSYSPGY